MTQACLQPSFGAQSSVDIGGSRAHAPSSSVGINIRTFVGYSILSVRKIASIFNGNSAQIYQGACFTVSRVSKFSSLEVWAVHFS